MPVPCSILIVDDEISLRVSLSRILTHDGYWVQSAGSLSQARELICGGCHFDLVILDLRFPDGLGTELMPLIRCKENAPRVMFLAAAPIETLPFDPAREGVAAYLEKPCEPEAILSTIRRLLAT